MSSYTLRAVVPLPFDSAVDAVRARLGEAGFGILTEIDLKATLKAKLDVDVEPQVILGACRPQLAYQALQSDPSIAALLPCNVVVRERNADSSTVEAFDPDAMTTIAASASRREALHIVALDARERLTEALTALEEN